MSSSNKNLNLTKKGSSSDNTFGNLFENNNDKKELEEDNDNNDSDDVEKKFGPIKVKSRSSNENEEDEEEENFQLNIIEDNPKENFSIGKYLNKTKKKEKKKNYEKKKHKSDDTFSKEDTENMDMVYSSSENFILDKNNKQSEHKKNSNSRFFNDFTIIKKLGKGGQGTVFEVKNNFDMQHYAIKRIILRLQNDKQEESIKEIKNEIYILSRHKSPYLVRYYQTWIEDYNKEDYANDSDFDDADEISSITSNRKVSFEEKSKSTLELNENNTKNYMSEEESLSEEKNKKINIWDDDDNDDEEEDEKESDEDEEESEDEKNKNNIKNKDYKKERESDKKKSRINYKSKSKKEKIGIKILYIQMELCGKQTLREAIDNNRLKTDDIKWKYINQLLEAILYVHSNGFIHRDLKPGNIFIDNDNDIKLGDFGLVKEYSTVKPEHNSIFSRSIFRRNDNSKIINFGGQLITMGIGTKFYCSPEQEKSDNYDNKTDIYSLGIIIFEMFYKFGSMMERDAILTRINKKSEFPEDLEEICGKNVTKLIRKCTQYKPSLRPSIKEIIESKLIPSFETNQNIFNQFNDFLEKNVKLINGFLNIIIDKKKNIFSDFKKSIINNENNTTQEDNTDSILSLNKSQLKRDLTDYNKALIDYENSYSSLFSPVIKLLELNTNKDNINDSSIFSLSIYQSLYFQVQKILHNSNAIYYKFSEYELFNQYNDFCYYNSTKKKFCRMYLNDEKNECFITETGRLLSKSKNLFSNFNKMISSIQNSRFNNNFTPITFYYDSSGNIKYRSPFSTSKEYLEYNDIICTSLWKDSEDSFDYDNKYVINNLKIILNILSDFKFSSKNILIRINSSIILDVIYEHFLKKNIDPKKLDETKLNILLTFSSVLNKRDAQYHINDLTEKLKKNNILNKIPIQINDLKTLIKSYYNIKKTEKLKTFESLEEKEKRINEENNIKEYFDDIYWEANIQNLLRYKDSVKIDYMLIPENLQFYSGFFLQVCYKKKNKIIPLIEGGITDNYFYNPEKSNQLKGFSFMINMKNIYELKIYSLGRIGNINDNLYLYDCLIIRTDETITINHLNELGKFFLECGLKYQVIYKPQSAEYEFEKYYTVYRMRYLITINLVERKKEKKRLFKVEKIKSRMDKKEKEKEEREKEKEERENIEVTYTIEEYGSKNRKDENLTLDKLRRKFKNLE